MRTTATSLRKHLFEYLVHVEKGESITIELNGREMGKIIPIKQEDWRKKINVKVKMKVPNISDAFAPLDDLWTNHN